METRVYNSLFPPRPGTSGRALRAMLIAAALVFTASAPAIRAQNNAYSPPAILDYFGSGWQTIATRMPDIFGAGYGELLTPPPTRADSGNQSVGYDVYNRFDLGSPNDPTNYGTITDYKDLINATHQMGGYFYTDYSMGHSGYSSSSSVDGNGDSFVNAGGYPGLLIEYPGNSYLNPGVPANIDGDFNGAYATSTQDARLAGLLNINFNTDYQYIRNPTTPGNPANIPGGTTPAYGRLANVPMPVNQQFYPDPNSPPLSVYNPLTGQQNIEIHSFNTTNPQAGSPAPENDTGYLMRNIQWFVQTLGVDGFRLDAVKNMQWPTALPYFDQAVYNASPRAYLNGVQEQMFTFSEYYDSNIPGASNPYQDSTVEVLQKSPMNPNGSFAGPAGTVQPNRDALDFPLFFALQGNLTGDGYTNNWNNVVNASLDSGLGHNGTVGVKFVQSQDNGAPYLSNVAYAYTLMMPGEAMVYYNGNTATYGNFPQNGREDALGGVYGNQMADNSLGAFNASNSTMTVSHSNQISGLVDIRNRYSTGNYIQRYLTQNNFAFERQDSSLVLLNNQTGGGNLNATLPTSFNPANVPYLVELTGNAAANGLPQVLSVNSNATVNVTFSNNTNSGGTFTGQGYLIYGPPTPIGTLTITNVASQIAGNPPGSSDPNITYDNGANTISNVAVIKNVAQFQIQLQTQKVYLLGNPNLYDPNAGGDNALLKIDGGIQIPLPNGTKPAFVSTNPGTITYGYIPFQNASPLVGGGTGLYAETVDTADLSQGYHYIDVIAFRHRTGTDAPPVFTDWTQSIYIDTAPPVSNIQSFNPITPDVGQNRSLVIQSVDGLANNIHVLLDLPAADTNSQILAMIGNANQATSIDANLWSINENNLSTGNHVATIVSYKPDGTCNIQRFTGLFVDPPGDGMGDLDGDGQYNVQDVQLFGSLLESHNTKFNPTADFDGDGLINYQDLLLFGNKLRAVGADTRTMQAYDQLLNQYSSATTPEPASLSLLSLGGGALLLRRRRCGWHSRFARNS